MLKNKLTFFLLLYITIIGAQTFQLKGTVVDQQNIPLSYANVLVEPLTIKNELKYTITSNQGVYNLRLDVNEYIVTVSYLGFKTRQKKVKIDKNITLNFQLKEQTNIIDEVIVEYPITIKEDTIVYNTDKFLKGNERKLKNILEQLPGVEVDEKGNVQLNGKKVKKLLINGKPFFGGNTRLGVINIPSNVVDKVTFLDNYNAVSFLKEMSDSDLLVMDISLKKDKTNFVFGDVALGLGNNTHYRNHNNLFLYTPKYTVNCITNVNDTGEKVLEFDDYFNFIGGVNTIFKNGFSEILDKGDFSQFLIDKNLLDSENKFVALNLSKTFNKKIDASGYVIFSNQKTETFEIKNNQYNSFSETNINRNFTQNKFLLAKYTIDYTPNKNTQVYIKSVYKHIINDFDSNIISTINTLDRTFKTNQNTVSDFINQNIEYHKKINKKQTISSTITVLNKIKTPQEHWIASTQLLSTLIPLQNDISYHLRQNEETKRQNLNIIVKHFWKISNIKHLYTTLGNTFSNQKLVSKTYQIMNDGSINYFDNLHYNNMSKFKINDLYLGLHYKFKLGKTILKQGFFIRNYTWSLSNDNTIKNTKVLFLPTFLLKLKISKSEKLILDYKLNSSFSNINKLTDKFKLTSYRSLTIGNPNLENELYHNLSLRYAKYNLYKGFRFIATFNYNNYNLGLVNSNQFQGTDYYSSYNLLSNTLERLNFKTHYSKSFDRIKYTFNINLEKRKYRDIENGISNNNQKENIDFGVAIKIFKFKNYPIINLAYNKKIGLFNYKNTKTRYYQGDFSATLNYSFLKHFIINTSYDYNYFSNENSNNSYDMANIKLEYYKKNSPWSFNLDVKNLFNTKYNQEISISDFMIIDTKHYTQPFTILFSVNYKL